MRPNRLIVGLLVTLVMMGAAVADECPFTQKMKKSVALHAQIREAFLAGQDFDEIKEELKACQTFVAEICIAELKEGQEHHPEAFVEVCKAAAELPYEGGRCELDFLTTGWDLLAFGPGLKNLKTTLAYLKLHAETHEEKEFYGKYLKEYAKYYKLAKARKAEFFGEDDGCGCGGHDHE